MSSKRPRSTSTSALDVDSEKRENVDAVVFNMLQEIREIYHGLGEKRPRVDSVLKIQSALVKHMSMLIYRSKLEANKGGLKNILVRHVVYVLRDCKLTMVRLLNFFMIKNSINKIVANHSSYIDGDDTKDSAEAEESQLEPISFDEATLNAQLVEADDTNYLDPMCLATVDFATEILRYKNCKPSIYIKILQAIEALKLNVKITKEDLEAATAERQVRVNNLSLALTAERYDCFEKCRAKHLNNKKGDMLLNEVHKVLPPNTIYDKNVKALFLFLAKETIASLFDQVYENRSRFETIKPDFAALISDKDLSTLKNRTINNFFQPVLVEELTAVTNLYWDKSFNDLSIPYSPKGSLNGDINDMFLRNRLIFQ